MNYRELAVCYNCLSDFTMAKNPLIHLEHLTKYYGAMRVLDDVSLEIGSGVTGLLGPNGAGKSTLIKVLLGLVRFSNGSGEVLGFSLRREARNIRANVGYMVEDDSYLAGISGVEMVRFVARLSGLPSIEGLRRAHEILDFCGIEQERYRNVETYSTGMRQKLKFAQAIVHDPPLLVLDEPTSGLDPEERERMLSRIRVLANHGKAVLLSTHILPDVQTVCDDVVIIVNGRIRLVEKLEVLSRPASPAYQVRVIGQPDALISRIQQENIEVTVAESGVITLPTSDETVVKRVWKWADEVEVGIRSLVPAKNSLEQIFLDAVREGKSANT